jgi:glycine betaine/choline ABC-type transport system substrate-binding protein
VLLIAPNAEERAPGLRQVLSLLDDSIDANQMRRANQHVDLDGGTVYEAAQLLADRMPR